MGGKGEALRGRSTRTDAAPPVQRVVLLQASWNVAAAVALLRGRFAAPGA